MDKRTEYRMRDRILDLLSDTEIAKTSTAEAATALAKGTEYIDLDALDEGVHTATGPVDSAGHMLPRSAVHAATWDKILAMLAARSA